MNRHLTEDERTELVLGLASLEQAEQYRAHLGECESCRRDLDEDRETAESLKEIPALSSERWNGMLREAVAPRQNTTEPDGAVGQFMLWAMRAALLALVFSFGYWVGATREGESAYPVRETPGIVGNAHDDDAVRSKPTPFPERLLGMVDDTHTEQLGRSLTTMRVGLSVAMTTHSLNY